MDIVSLGLDLKTVKYVLDRIEREAGDEHFNNKVLHDFVSPIILNPHECWIFETYTYLLELGFCYSTKIP